MLKRILLGGLVVGLFAASDGVLVGLVVALVFNGDEPLPVVGKWALVFGAVGAILGGVLGAFWKALVMRLTLGAPTETATDAKPPMAS